MAGLHAKRWKTPSGQARWGWQVSWYPADGGKRKWKLFSGKGAQARAKAHQRKVESVEPANGDQTVETAAEAWAKHIEAKGRARSTWEGYRRHFEQHINGAMIARGAPGPDGKPSPAVRFGSLKVAEIDGPDCEALMRALLDKVGIDHTAVLMRDLRMMLKDCIRRGWSKGNPAAAVTVERHDRGEDEVVIPEKAELQAIVDLVRTRPPAPPSFSEVWIRSTMVTGMRPGENRGAAIDDLVLEGGKPGIHVRRAADEWNVLGAVKTKNGRRFIPIGPELAGLFKRWLLVVPRGRPIPDPARPGKTIHLLFPTVDGTVQGKGNIHNRMWVPTMAAAELGQWAPACNRAGVPKLDEKTGQPILRFQPLYAVNCLRHLAASLMIELGLNEKQLQFRMGHANIQITLQLYGHLFKEARADSDTATRIERMFRSGRKP